MSPPGRWEMLTAPQAGMWLDGAGDASSATYNIGNYVRLVGDLDVEALARAISQTDAESDCAQLRFVQQDGLPFQRLAEKAAPTDFAVIDLRRAPDPAAAARLEMEAFRRRPFDKAAGPLCGHRLLWLGPDEHWWFRSYSHLITDGLSSHILAERTAQIYNALKRGEAPPDAWFGRYADFIAEEEAYPGSAAYERDVAYWRERLANGGPVSRFKLGNDTAGIEVAEFPARLDAGRIAGLQVLAERSKASLAAVAMALYYLLLGRMAGTQRPTALTPFGNRLGRQERSTPGAFAFALPCTVDLAGKHSIGELARDIFGQLRRDMRHMRLAPIRMRAALGRSSRPDADGAGVNIIGVVPPLSFDGLSASVVNFYTGLTSDISLIFVGEELGDGGTGAYLHWRYNAARYTRAEVARIAARFEHLLDSVLADPDQPLADLTLMPEAEIATIRRWEAGPALSAEMQAPLLPARIADIMHRFPDHVAIIADDGTETRYGQLDRLASAIERNLLKAGVQRGDLVGLGCLPGPALVAGLIALWRRGAAAVMLDPVLPIARRRAMAETIDVKLVLCDSATLWPEADRGAIHAVDLAGWMAEAAGDAAGDASAVEGVEPAENDIAIVFHTAGSTGQPKPVAVPHGALCRKTVSVAGHYALGSADAGDPETVVLSPAMGFDPWIQELGMALITGARLWTLRRETLLDGHRFWNEATRHGATYINLTPTLMEGLIDHAPVDGRHAVRHVVLGGEVFSPELAARLRAVLGDAALWNGYGPTETVVDITAYRLPHRFSGDRVPIGPVSPGGLVRVIGPDGRRAPIGMLGELYLGGACVSHGYIGMPEATAAAFLPDPLGETEGIFYRSGDLASWGEDGTLTYRGRNDSQVKVRGQRIELGEVESGLRRLPGIAQAAVLHVGDSHGGHLRAFVTRAPDAGGDIAPAAIRQTLARHLPEAAIPSAIAVLESLPHLPSGKIDRAALAILPEQATAVSAPARAVPGLSARQHQVQQAVAAVWRDLIGAGEIDPQANLFDIGVHSLLVLRAQGRLGRIAGREVSSVEVFEYPSIAAFARYLTHGSDAGAPSAARQPLAVERPGAIAIIGMGMRLPGADNRADFWTLLEAGRDCVRDIDAARLRAFGVDPSLLQDSGFVARHGLLEDIDGFDPAPFGMSPADTLETDPQQRLLLETALTALEDACCDPERDGPVGVYVGVGFPTYLLDALAPQRTTNTLDMARYALALGNDKDHAATRLAYRLNLTGPAIAAGTACSTGLVNVASAVQALRAGQCRVALAGGAALGTGVTGGYRFAEGGIGSRSGVCRPFDSQADGVVGGSGAAIVALKRLEDALADGDTVHAVILGVGLSNDGARKAAFTAPSVEGQAAALSAALVDAGVAPGSVRFIEAHGTATSLGDPIEVAALNQIYGPRQDRPIWLGSLKGNMGHLDSAAGVAGLLKAVLALQHRMVPPSCHFQQPNPRIPFDRGPFQVADRPIPLDADETPLRAGVSSFGVGGTNAHVILEAAPPRPDSPATSAALATPQILIFSAASEKPLDALLRRTADSFAGDLATVGLSDIAFSLRARRRYPHRVAILARDMAEAAAALRAPDHPGHIRAVAAKSTPPVVFLFPGQGSQSPGMAAALYRDDAAIRDRIDRACATVTAMGGPADLRDLLLTDRRDADSVARMARTEIAQPALFIVSYAIAERLMAYGVRPTALAGHSIGEYAAACLAEVMSFDDALRLVTLRGRLMGQSGPGAMLALPATEPEVVELLSAQAPDLSLAAINGPRQCVVAGRPEEIDALEAHLRAIGKPGQRLTVSHAFHSATMEPILEEFRAEAAKIALYAPTIPLQSNLTGDWLSDANARSPDYWTRHLRHSVRFADNMKSLLARFPDSLAIECGAGRTASRLAQINGLAGDRAVASQPFDRAQPTMDGETALFQALSRLWAQGVEPDWSALAPARGQRRIPLPTYPFDRKRYWPEIVQRDAAQPEAVLNGAAHGHLSATLQSSAANDAALGAGHQVVGQQAGELPARDTLETVISIWYRLFGDTTIGAHDDFLERGGDSLLAVRIASLLSEELGTDIPVAELFEGRTPAEMAARIDARFARSAIPPTGATIDRPAAVGNGKPRERGVL